MSTTEAQLKALGIDLPPPAAPPPHNVPFVRSGNLVFVSGQLPMGPQGLAHVGKLGADADLDTGKAAARLCGINLIAQLKAAIGDLDRLVRVVKLTGFVNATLDFADHPKVINGASDLMVEVFGERGRHSRSAVGAAGLPFGAAVEVEAIFEVA
jgi:enamine deaminase RidA (YjgF/YER057c/UK114 family)